MKRVVKRWVQFRVSLGNSILWMLMVKLLAFGVLIISVGRNYSLGTEGTINNSFTYEGKLMANGSPVSGQADFQFSLYNSLTEGLQIGSTITFTKVLVEDGFFQLLLNFGASAFEGNERYLEIAVRYPAGSGKYILLSPRQPITPAPYALYALNIPEIKSSSAQYSFQITNTSATGTAIYGKSDTPSRLAQNVLDRQEILSSTYEPTGVGVYGESNSHNGAGVYGKGTVDFIPGVLGKK